MSVDRLVGAIVKNNQKAKLAILKELTLQEVDSFDLSEIIRKKYYEKDFIAFHFVEALEKDRLIEKRERKFWLTNKELTSKILSANHAEVERILSLPFGNGDLVDQLGERRTIF